MQMQLWEEGAQALAFLTTSGSRSVSRRRGIGRLKQLKGQAVYRHLVNSKILSSLTKDT